MVSPQWILQSLDRGSLQRCAQVSLDTLRSLPPASAAPASAGDDGSPLPHPPQAASLPASAAMVHGDEVTD